MKIGFIGQGWIGKHYADDFVNRGYEVVRYSLEEEYKHNREEIKHCDIVFIAVPTPTTLKGFDFTPVSNALQNIGKGKSAVIKSTIVVGTTEKLQKQFPDIFVFHSPEFLVEKTATFDAAHPNRNIVGIPVESKEYQKRAQEILDVLPPAPYQKIMHARDAELVKYAGNCFLYTKVIFMNLLYDLAQTNNNNWNDIKDAFAHDPRIGQSHTEPVHQSGHLSNSSGSVKRGAGGHCLIKDFEAFREMYRSVHDVKGEELLEKIVSKNIDLLVKSAKDIELLEGVYGPLDK
jgi:UDPglucose 6-dehydrogenase